MRNIVNTPHFTAKIFRFRSLFAVGGGKIFCGIFVNRKMISYICENNKIFAYEAQRIIF